MKRLLLVLGIALAESNAEATPSRAASTRTLPLVFEENLGQSDPSVRFIARGPRYTAFLEPGGVVLALRGSVGGAERSAIPRAPASPLGEPEVVDVLRLELVGASPDARLMGFEPLPSVSHYLVGSDPRGWRRGVPHFAEVRHASAYRGVDVLFNASGGQLEFDFVVAPGVDPAAIRLAFRGASALAIDPAGDVLASLRGGELRLRLPAVQQEIEGRRVEVPGSFVLLGEDEVGFRLASWDRGHPLLIDPVLVYSTYLGGGGPDQASAVEVDSSGGVYLVGVTESSDFPMQAPLQGTHAGNQDLFVAKLTPAGDALVYSTYLGGTSQDSPGRGLAVDTAGSVHLAGFTASTDFPTQDPLQETHAGGPVAFPRDGFVAKLTPEGDDLVFSTFLGGTGQDHASAVALGTGSGDVGNVYVTGLTDSTDFPTAGPVTSLAGNFDSFVAKLSASGGVLLYSRYLGGGAFDAAHEIDVDDLGSAYLAGQTASADYPTQAPFQGAKGIGADGFVTKLVPSGAGLAFSTFLGGNGGDELFDLVVDGAGAVHVTGWTDSTDLPTASAFQAANAGGFDAFVAKIDPAGSPLVYGTYFGGGGTDIGVALALDDAGNAHVVGDTGSTNLPMLDPIQEENAGGASDAALWELDAAGSLVHSTYLGGTGLDQGNAIAVDAFGNVHLVGETTSADFPVQNAIQPGHSGSLDGFLLRISPAGATLRPGDAVVASETDGQGVLRVDPVSGAQADVMDGLGNAFSGLALEPGGRLLVSREDPAPLSPDVRRVDPLARVVSELTSGAPLLAPRTLAIESDGRVLVADEQAGALFRTPAGAGPAVSVSAGFASGPRGIALEANGNILVTDGTRIVRVNPVDGQQTDVCTGLSAPTALSVGNDGAFFAIDGSSILKNCLTLSSGGSLVDPRDLDAEASGDLLVVDAGSGGASSVIRVDSDTGAQTILPAPLDLADPVAIALVPQAVAMVHPEDDPVGMPMLNGLASPGGLEVTVDAIEAGPLTADYETKTPQEQQDCIVTGECPPPDFAVPGGGETQHWQIGFGGLFQGLATLVFRYDEGLLGGFPEIRLAVYHFVLGAWRRLNVVDRNTTANTITVEVPAADGFSPFALGVVPACQDGEDNDGDLLVDLSDPGCTDLEDHSELFDCSDGINNDADGLVDWPADTGCTGASDPLETQDGRICDDGDDDDGDDLPDYRSDPGCKDALSTREDPACDDGIDNDNDGGIDWDGTPPDAQCFAAWRNKERAGGGCGLGGEIVLVVPLLAALRRRHDGRSARARK